MRPSFRMAQWPCTVAEQISQEMEGSASARTSPQARQVRIVQGPGIKPLWSKAPCSKGALGDKVEEVGSRKLPPLGYKLGLITPRGVSMVLAPTWPRQRSVDRGSCSAVVCVPPAVENIVAEISFPGNLDSTVNGFSLTGILETSTPIEFSSQWTPGSWREVSTIWFRPIP